jgi:hypothetical protein
LKFGGQQAFYNDGAVASSILTLEGVGILIPPQVEFYVRASAFNALLVLHLHRAWDAIFSVLLLCLTLILRSNHGYTSF